MYIYYICSYLWHYAKPRFCYVPLFAMCGSASQTASCRLLHTHAEIHTHTFTHSHPHTHLQTDKQLISLSELNNKHKNIHH